MVTAVREAIEALLGPGAVATHCPNHTGAGKLSYEVRARGERWWVKVAASDEEGRRLTRWASVATILAERHGAPPVLEVLDVLDRTALLFPFLDHPVATRSTLLDRYAEVGAVLDGLHADHDLAGRLGGPVTGRESFRDVWVSRFEADLRIIAGHVAPDVYDYLAAEVETLAALVDGLDLPVHHAIHGDPWHENVLLGWDRVWLIDWESIAVGDPVIDRAILLMDVHGAQRAAWPTEPRHQVARRALLLDAAVDGAADWVQSSEPAMRRAKEVGFHDGLAAYRADVHLG
ncbi:MAG TPA: aminoglycoside phosphotransferase family protein [Nocardioides sp.]|uniref:aminoglycoside phosphotransferase family protein n=1 Tax=Nocardioides sp. TaxID=35761 RepID=UPI002E35F6FF|nr:aminoglycoside phosphotransferase family protein [Nocardioides sp.]HEX3931531.1 aminoglycoside phosphotransferase family protein [Nocardioides sp.]